MEDMPQETIKFVLRSIFGRDPLPDAYWVGLVREIPDEKTLAAFTALEPREADGYSRKRINRGDFAIEDRRAISPLMRFVNNDVVNWPQVVGGFIATSEDGSGALLGWSLFRRERPPLFPSDAISTDVSIEW